MDDFDKEVKERIKSYADNNELNNSGHAFLVSSVDAKYSYNFSWAGLPIIQYPPDIIAMQEIIWQVKPDLIIETGIARGGSLIFYASMLMQLEMSAALEQEVSFTPHTCPRRVLGIDIDIRAHNRKAITEHPFSAIITMLEGSSIEDEIIKEVVNFAKDYQRIMVCLDSNHTHEHVLKELYAYAPLVSQGSYCVVFDTLIEDMPDASYPDRPWGIGNNPKTAVYEFLKDNDSFTVDDEFSNKLIFSVSHGGFLKKC